MMLPMPYFMTNTEWYCFDEKEFRYQLTDKATPEAIDSYNEFYKQLDYMNENGNMIEIKEGDIIWDNFAFVADGLKK